MKELLRTISRGASIIVRKMSARHTTKHLRTPLLLLAVLVLAPLASAQVLEVINGVVELREAPDQPWRPASTAEPFNVGSSLRSFQGNARVALGQNSFLQIDHASALTRDVAGYAELQGKLYGRSTDLRLDVGLPDLRLLGEGRVDALESGAHRIAVFSGEALAWLKNDLVIIHPGEQLYVPASGEPPILSTYFERDPWYRSLMSLTSGTGQVEAAFGNNEIRLPGEDWRVANPGTAFVEGAHARTHENAWLEIRFDDGNLIRLQANSEIRLIKLDEYEDGSRHTVLELLSGSVWAVVVNEGQPFEIETPGLVAGVRGTKFRLDAPVGDQPPQLKVFEGLVIGITETRGVPVRPGETYSPDESVEPTVPDEVDDFNLVLDVIVPDADGTKPGVPPPVTPPSPEQPAGPAPDSSPRQEKDPDSPCAGQSEGRGQGRGNNCREARSDSNDDVGASGGAGKSPAEESRAVEPVENEDKPVENEDNCAGQSEGRGNGRGNNCRDNGTDSGETKGHHPSDDIANPSETPEQPHPDRSEADDPGNRGSDRPGRGAPGAGTAEPGNPGRGAPPPDDTEGSCPGRGKGRGEGRNCSNDSPESPPQTERPATEPDCADQSERSNCNRASEPDDDAPKAHPDTPSPPPESSCPGKSEGRGQGRGGNCPDESPPSDDAPVAPCPGQGKGRGQDCREGRAPTHLFPRPSILSGTLPDLALSPMIRSDT